MKPMDIKDYTLDQFQAWLQDNGIRTFRAAQVFKWLYGRHAGTFEEMTNLKQSLRAGLAGQFSIRSPEIAERRIQRLFTLGLI